MRRVLGLLLLLLATQLAILDRDVWTGWVQDVRHLCYPNEYSSSPAPLVPADSKPTGDAATSSKCWMTCLSGIVNSNDLMWLRITLILACGLVVLLLHGAKPIWFVFAITVTAGWFFVAALGVNLLLGGNILLPRLLLGAVGAGYLVQTAARPSRPTLQGTLGLLLVFIAGLGILKGWYHQVWTWVGARTGPGPANFTAEWRVELAWATCLLLAMIGAFWSRTKAVYFLIAILLAAIAFHCVMSGRTQVRLFEKTATGDFVRVKSEATATEQPSPETRRFAIEDERLTNVTTWRWILAGELVLVSLILLYRALGIGALCLTFAIAWVAVGSLAYSHIRSTSFMGYAYNLLRAGSAPMTGPSPTTASRPGAMDNMGLPITTAPTPLNREHASPPPRSGLVTRQSTIVVSGPTSNKANADQADAMLTRRELGLIGWAYLTALLAGVMGATGLQRLCPGASSRHWVTIALWVASSVACTVLWYAHPRAADQGWASWVSDWSQSEYKLHVVWLVFLASAAFFGSWALRHDERSDYWINTTIVCTFAGTVLTLIGLTLLAQFGGVEPVRETWKYGAIAVGQSSLAWVLLMYQSLTGRDTPPPQST